MTQNAPTSPPTPNTGSARLNDELIGRIANRTAAPATAMIAGTMCDSPTHARTTAVSALCLPVSSTRANSPRKTRQNDRLIDIENSPASVDAMLPP